MTVLVRPSSVVLEIPRAIAYMVSTVFFLALFDELAAVCFSFVESLKAFLDSNLNFKFFNETVVTLHGH